jgi:hypothetical protein
MMRRKTLRVTAMSAALASIGTAVCLLAAAPSAEPANIAGLSEELAPPVRVMAGGKAIDLSDAMGHAAPFYDDIDGDGVSDLLVGQFKDGQLRIYHNTGSTRQPLFDSNYTWFKAGADLGRVPSG